MRNADPQVVRLRGRRRGRTGRGSAGRPQRSARERGRHGFRGRAGVDGFRRRSPGCAPLRHRAAPGNLASTPKPATFARHAFGFRDAHATTISVESWGASFLLALAVSSGLERPAILDAIESDADLSVGRAFAEVIAGYLAETRHRETRVTTRHTPEAIAARFDEPLPRDGRSIESIVERIRDEVIAESQSSLSPALRRTSESPAAAGRDLDRVGHRGAQSIARRVRDVAGRHGARAPRHLMDVRPRRISRRQRAARSRAAAPRRRSPRCSPRAARRCPTRGPTGVGADPPVLLCGEHAHYAVTRAAGELGLGMRNVLRDRIARLHDGSGRRCAGALDDLARDGRRVMAVVATAGSTATGSFDDLEAIADALRASTASGCTSTRRTAGRRCCPRDTSPPAARHRARALDRVGSAQDDADAQRRPGCSSCATSAISTRRSRSARRICFTTRDGERVWDQGTRSFMCSRRADVLKLWVALAALRRRRDSAQLLRLLLRARPLRLRRDRRARRDFEALHEPECNILCFRYVGDGSRSDEALDRAQSRAARALQRSGEGWITATNLDGRRVLRVTMMNPRTTDADVRDDSRRAGRRRSRRLAASAHPATAPS